MYVCLIISFHHHVTFDWSIKIAENKFGAFILLYLSFCFCCSMSTSNKRFFDDDITNSTSSIKKHLCISLVPSVPRGGTDYLHNHSISLDINSNSKELIFDAGDRIILCA